MLKIVKHLHEYKLWVMLVLILLVVQAFSELALPEYTARIVNVGIQQGGIEDSIPEVIRQTEFNKLLSLLPMTEQELLIENYRLLSTESQSEWFEAYPLLVTESLYQLELIDEASSDQLSKIFSKAIFILSNGFRTDPTILAVEEFFLYIPEMIAEQTAIAFIKNEYEIIGVDTAQLQTNYIFVSGLFMLGFTLISLSATIIVTLLSARIGTGVSKKLRGLIFSKVLSFSNRELDQFGTASLITRTTNDVQQIENLLIMSFRIIVYAPILATGGIIKVMSTNSTMSWVVGVAIFAISVIITVLLFLVMPKFKLLQQLIDQLNLVSREILTGLPVIRAFHNEKHEESRFDKANFDVTRTSLFLNRSMTAMMPAMMLIMNGTTMLIIWVSAEHIQAGTMQVGDMMAFIQYAMQVVMSFLMFSMVAFIFPRASVSAKRIMEVLDTETLIQETKNPKTFSGEKKGYLEFKHVSFRYPNAEKDVLHNIHFTARPGETTAIIGSTGSGKSTLVNLIPRFFDVTSGEIFINDIEITDITLHDLREKIGFVPQKSLLFSGTIESNIQFGNKQACEEDLQRAAKIAQAIDFIDEKPDRYKSEVSQGGTNVSGGQRQRLSIARAVASNPEIYIFDDSFSALDYQTDINLRNALREETKDSTVIIVAQRISTIFNADQILVLDDGEIVGRGTHRELLQNCEVYKQIALSQLSKEELENE